jgi:hypothetical protein
MAVEACQEAFQDSFTLTLVWCGNQATDPAGQADPRVHNALPAYSTRISLRLHALLDCPLSRAAELHWVGKDQVLGREMRVGSHGRVKSCRRQMRLGLRMRSLESKKGRFERGSDHVTVALLRASKQVFPWALTLSTQACQQRSRSSKSSLNSNDAPTLSSPKEFDSRICIGQRGRRGERVGRCRGCACVDESPGRQDYDRPLPCADTLIF